MKLFILLGMGLVLIGCSSQETKPANTYRDSTDQRPIVDDKYSLTQDRKEMEAMRSQIPDDKKTENDELALILGLMSDVKKEPSEIRRKFDTQLRKKRELFNKDMSKERDQFTKDERKKRESFLKAQTDARTIYQRERQTKEARAEFFNDQDSKRKEFFADLREKRNDFESDVLERRKNFEDYAREKSNEFNQEHRAFIKRREEWKKEQASASKTLVKPAGSMLGALTGNPDLDELEQGLEEAKRRGTSPLSAGE
jgi:hypothetical protein